MNITPIIEEKKTDFSFDKEFQFQDFENRKIKYDNAQNSLLNHQFPKYS